MATADTSDLGAVSEAAQASTDTPDGNPVSQELEKDQEASDIPAPYRFSSCEHCTKTVHAGHGRLLDCFHVVCGNCLGGLLRYDGTLVCPKCRKRTSRAKEQQRLGRSLTDLLPRVGIPSRGKSAAADEEERDNCCTDCKDIMDTFVPGTHWCAECEYHFCDDHAEEHRRRRATKLHPMSLLSSAENANDGDVGGVDNEKQPQVVMEASSPATACVLHPDEALKFCQECDELLCSSCQETGGCDHQIAEYSETTLTIKHEALLCKLGGGPEGSSSDDVEKIYRAYKGVCEEIAAIGRDGKRVSKEITECFQGLVALVEARMKIVLSNLDEMIWQAAIPLENKRNTLFDVYAESRRATDFLKLYDLQRHSSNSTASHQANMAFMQLLPTMNKLTQLVSMRSDLKPCLHPEFQFMSSNRGGRERDFRTRLTQVGHVADVTSSPDGAMSEIVFRKEPRLSGEMVVVEVKANNGEGAPVQEGSSGNKKTEWIVTFYESQRDRGRGSSETTWHSTSVMAATSGRCVVASHRLLPNTSSVKVSCTLGNVDLPKQIVCKNLRRGFQLDIQRSSKCLLFNSETSVSCNSASDCLLTAYATSDFGHESFKLRCKVKGERVASQPDMTVAKEDTPGVLFGLYHQDKAGKWKTTKLNAFQPNATEASLTFEYSSDLKETSSGTPKENLRLHITCFSPQISGFPGYPGRIPHPSEYVEKLLARTTATEVLGEVYPFIAFLNVKATVSGITLS